MARYSDNVFPIMTSNTTPPPHSVTPIGNSANLNNAFLRFNSDLYSTGTALGTGTNSIFPIQIIFDFGEENKIKIDKFKLFRTGLYGLPRDWKIRASNDNVNWDILFEITDDRSLLDSEHLVTNGSVVSVYADYKVFNTKEYRYYNFFFERTYGASGTGTGNRFDSVAEIQGFILLPSEKHLIKSSNKIQTLVNNVWTDTLLTEPLTKANFDTHGMDDISTISYGKWMELDDEFEVVTFTDDTEVKWLEINTDSFSPLEKINQETAFEVITYSDNHEVLASQTTGILDTIDEGKLFKATLEDFTKITGVGVV